MWSAAGRCDEALLRATFAGYARNDLSTDEAEIAEGRAHCGLSGLIGFLASNPELVPSALALAGIFPTLACTL